MKKIIIILTLFTLVGCATSGGKEEKLYDLLHITDGYAMKSPTIEDLTKKDFN